MIDFHTISFQRRAFCNRTTSNRNGTNAISASDTFTSQSARPRETHRGNSGPNPISGSISLAQATSFEGSKDDNDTEKAIVKNNAVSMDDPTSVEVRGACHHLLFLNLQKFSFCFTPIP